MNNLEKFYLIAVDAEPKIRFERMLKRKKDTDVKSFDEFEKIDRRDRGINQPTFGQGVKKCIQMADFQINNDGRLDELYLKVNSILSGVLLQEDLLIKSSLEDIKVGHQK